MTQVRATLRIVFASDAEARRVEGSLKADDDAFVTTRREGVVLVVDARAADLGALRRALDDVLACASVSEAVIKSASFDE